MQENVKSLEILQITGASNGLMCNKCIDFIITMNSYESYKSRKFCQESRMRRKCYFPS